MDPEIASGIKPEECAKQLFKSIVSEDNEYIPFQYILAMYLFAIIPRIYYYIMERRARNPPNH